MLKFACIKFQAIMTHRYFANLTIGITTLTQEQYQTIKSILFDTYSAMAFVRIPNQWVFSIEASSREIAKEEISKTLAQIITTLGLDELSFTLYLSYENIGIGTMHCKRLFPKKTPYEA